jgi:ABC-type lipoprotein release transport system permease subunit
MNRLQKRVLIVTGVILAISLFYVPYEELTSNSTIIVGLLLGVCLLYSLTRFVRDFRRRDITPPRLYGGDLFGIGDFAPTKPVRWTKRQTVEWMLKVLVALIVGTTIVVLIAKYYPEYLPRRR